MGLGEWAALIAALLWLASSSMWFAEFATTRKGSAKVPSGFRLLPLKKPNQSCSFD
ncbi:hypothetical protein GCM10011571_35330 [Marinithermofilum abyssi]|uniref:Uncharacterized protein n=1 Tax=Marinithermofilum abyssi TaxID=1571185 RepID=A0A8J2YFR0_9BACL|nr:hypothetical protein GCM10011571_35330 [Marinithermofilum abyssi]